MKGKIGCGSENYVVDVVAETTPNVALTRALPSKGGP